MVFKDDFVVAIKSGGEFLREYDGTVLLPFGAEYGIYLKNLNTRDAAVSIEVDGEDVLDGNQVVVPADSSIEVERYLQDQDKGNGFKFIKKTERMREHRGENPEDEIVRVVYQFARPQQYDDHYIPYTDPFPEPVEPWIKPTNPWDCEPYVIWHSTSTDEPYSYIETYGHYETACGAGQSNEIPSFTSDEGITAPGSVSHQEFKDRYIGPLEPEKHVLTLQLKGKVEGEHVEEPVKSRKKLECTSCGKKSRSDHKYCPECGTALVVI